MTYAFKTSTHSIIITFYPLKNEIDQEPDVIKRMHSVLKNKFSLWPDDILHLFVKTQTFIRIKFLNNKLKSCDAKAKLMNLKQKGQFQY